MTILEQDFLRNVPRILTEIANTLKENVKTNQELITLLKRKPPTKPTTTKFKV